MNNQCYNFDKRILYSKISIYSSKNFQNEWELILYYDEKDYNSNLQIVNLNPPVKENKTENN